MQNQNKLSRFIPAFIILFILSVAAYFIWQWNEQFEIIEFNSLTEKAEVKLNELYAAEVFIKKLNHPAESQSSANHVVDHLPPKQDLIIYTHSTERLTNPIRRDALLNWVKSGGHLIINARQTNEPDPILLELGLHKKVIQDHLDEQEEKDNSSDEDSNEDIPSDDEEDDDDTETRPIETKLEFKKSQNLFSALKIASAASTVAASNKRPIYIDQPLRCVAPESLSTAVPQWDDGETLCGLLSVYPGEKNSPQLHFCTDYYLYDDSGNATPSAIDQWGLPHILDYAIGEGHITVLENHDFLTNARILYFDHAYYLSQLIKDKGKVWLIFEGQSESLPIFLWKRAKWVIIITILCIAFYLWRNMVRLGPMITAPNPARRQLMEHLQASALFKWKHKQNHAEFKKIQRDILLAAARKQGRNNIDFEKDSSWIAISSQLTETEIRATLSANCPSDPLEFVALTQSLYRLRMQL